MAAAEPLALASGSHLGRYQLLERLAIGGMAELYVARASGIEGFEKRVVLKRILPHLALDEEFVSMFLQEARLAATLHHSNIVDVYDIGLSQGSYFFTMEYVHGVDVRSIAHAQDRTGQGIPLEHGLAIVIGAAAGLHHAHEHRADNGQHLAIVHRDVSTSNVLVGFDGNVKVVDFGIAKAASHSSETRSGTIKGKVAYMSPEQCCSEKLDRRSDVFSLGTVLYKLITGVLPFGNGSEFAVMNSIVNTEPVPPSSLRPDCSPELEQIVLKALRKNRAERFASAEALQVALEAYVREHRLLNSPVALASYVRSLFPEKTLSPADAAPALPTRTSKPDTFVTAGTTENMELPDEQRRPGTRWAKPVVGLAGIGVGFALVWHFATGPVPTQPVPLLVREDPVAITPAKPTPLPAAIATEVVSSPAGPVVEVVEPSPAEVRSQPARRRKPANPEPPPTVAAVSEDPEPAVVAPAAPPPAAVPPPPVKAAEKKPDLDSWYVP